MLKMFMDKIKSLSGYAKFCAKIGAFTMLCFYIIAIIAYKAAPTVGYEYALRIVGGCLEAAPACLVSGLLAAGIFELMLARGKNG